MRFGDLEACLEERPSAAVGQTASSQRSHERAQDRVLVKPGLTGTTAGEGDRAPLCRHESSTASANAEDDRRGCVAGKSGRIGLSIPGAHAWRPRILTLQAQGMEDAGMLAASPVRERGIVAAMGICAVFDPRQHLDIIEFIRRSVS
jgi:hypothetical protein